MPSFGTMPWAAFNSWVVVLSAATRHTDGIMVGTHRQETAPRVQSRGDSAHVHPPGDR